MSCALVAEVLWRERCVPHDLATVGVLAVEGAKRVELCALQAVGAHLVRMVHDERADLVAVRRTARRIAHGVDGEAQGLRIKAQALEEGHEHDDALGVCCGIGGAQPFDADLVELAQPPFLRTLAAEHRARIPELCRRPSLRHEVVLHRGTHDARRSLGTECETLLGLETILAPLGKQALNQRAREHAEHLLAHHVGRLADAVHEGRHLLDGGRLDHVEPVGAKHIARTILHTLPRTHVFAVQILGPLNPLSHDLPFS